MAQQVINPTSIHKDMGSIPDLLSVLRIPCCCKVWHRSWMQPGSHVAVAVAEAGSCSSDLNPTNGAALNRPKKKKKKKKSFSIKCSEKLKDACSQMGRAKQMCRERP